MDQALADAILLTHLAFIVWVMSGALATRARAGLLPYQGPFVLHYLDAIVYPNLPPALGLTSGVLVCSINLLMYGFRLYRHLAKR
jgi:hypothetical protein